MAHQPDFLDDLQTGFGDRLSAQHQRAIGSGDEVRFLITLVTNIGAVILAIVLGTEHQHTTAGLIFGHSRCSNRYSWSVPYPETPAATILWLEMRGLSNSVKRSSASASSPQTNESPKEQDRRSAVGSELDVAQTKAVGLHMD